MQHLSGVLSRCLEKQWGKTSPGHSMRYGNCYEIHPLIGIVARAFRNVLWNQDCDVGCHLTLPSFSGLIVLRIAHAVLQLLSLSRVRRDDGSTVKRGVAGFVVVVVLPTVGSQISRYVKKARRSICSKSQKSKRRNSQNSRLETFLQTHQPTLLV